MTPDAEGLHEIANTDKPNRKADIVFVHGLGGFSHSTWRHGRDGEVGRFFWPEELGKDLPDCGIWSLGYPAGFTALGKPGMIVEKRAGNLSQKLANAGLGERPLLFIGHSMGGLVVKSLIVGSQTLADADRKRLVGMIRGIVFCATPHRGSAFADAAGVLGKFFGGSQDHVDEMRANAEPLDILHDQFIEWHRINQIPVDSYAENIGLKRKDWLGRVLPLGLVVPRASANPGIAGHTVRDVDDDHLSLVKPSNRNHDVYAGVLRFVRDAVASEAASGLISPQEFVDDRVRSAAVALNQARADKSLTMRTLIGTLDGLFDRNAFRREPSVGLCVTKEWDIRLHSALQTLRLLDDYALFVKTEAGRSWELYRELTAEISRYGERMAAFLFDPPIGLAGLRNLVGTEGFIHAIQKHTKLFQGANVKVAPETCEMIDPHLTKAIDLMDTLQNKFRSPTISHGTIPVSPFDAAPSPVSAAAASPSPALAIWQKRLAFLQAEEAKAADAAQKFSIQQGIDDARTKIRELGG